MSRKPWESPRWPEDVPHEITGYEKPLFSLLDNTARQFPDAVYSLFDESQERISLEYVVQG
jgi:long-chain acyl-CoA synthetase